MATMLIMKFLFALSFFIHLSRGLAVSEVQVGGAPPSEAATVAQECDNRYERRVIHPLQSCCKQFFLCRCYRSLCAEPQYIGTIGCKSDDAVALEDLYCGAEYEKTCSEFTEQTFASKCHDHGTGLLNEHRAPPPHVEVGPPGAPDRGMNVPNQRPMELTTRRSFWTTLNTIIIVTVVIVVALIILSCCCGVCCSSKSTSSTKRRLSAAHQRNGTGEIIVSNKSSFRQKHSKYLNKLSKKISGMGGEEKSAGKPSMNKPANVPMLNSGGSRKKSRQQERLSQTLRRLSKSKKATSAPLKPSSVKSRRTSASMKPTSLKSRKSRRSTASKDSKQSGASKQGSRNVRTSFDGNAATSATRRLSTSVGGSSQRTSNSTNLPSTQRSSNLPKVSAASSSANSSNSRSSNTRATENTRLLSKKQTAMTTTTGTSATTGTSFNSRAANTRVGTNAGCSSSSGTKGTRAGGTVDGCSFDSRAVNSRKLSQDQQRQKTSHNNKNQLSELRKAIL